MYITDFRNYEKTTEIQSNWIWCWTLRSLVCSFCFLFIFFRSHLILIETLKMKLSLKNIFYEMLSTDRLVHYLARLRFDYHGNRTMFCFFLNWNRSVVNRFKLKLFPIDTVQHWFVQKPSKIDRIDFYWSRLKYSLSECWIKFVVHWLSTEFMINVNVLFELKLKTKKMMMMMIVRYQCRWNKQIFFVDFSDWYKCRNIFLSIVNR